MTNIEKKESKFTDHESLIKDIENATTEQFLTMLKSCSTEHHRAFFILIRTRSIR